MQVTFNIIRGDVPGWRRVMKRLDYKRMLLEVKEHTNFTAKHLDVGYDDAENRGVIFANNQIAGTFFIGKEIRRVSTT